VNLAEEVAGAGKSRLERVVGNLLQARVHLVKPAVNRLIERAVRDGAG
jgi:hypothetical protein